MTETEQKPTEQKPLGKAGAIFTLAGIFAGTAVGVGKDIISIPGAVCSGGKKVIGKRSKKEGKSEDVEEAQVVEEGERAAETIAEPVVKRTKSRSVRKGDESAERGVKPATKKGAESAVKKGAEPVEESKEPAEKTSPQENKVRKVRKRSSGIKTEDKSAETGKPKSLILEKEVEAAEFENSADKKAFIKALSELDNKTTAVRGKALLVLGGIKHNLSVKVLAAHFSREPSGKNRKYCINSLVELEAKKGVATVQEALKDRALIVRLVAMRALCILLRRKAGPDILSMFEDENEDVRNKAVNYIEGLEYKLSPADLSPYVKHKNYSVRLTSLDAVERSMSMEMVPQVIELLKDPNRLVRKKAFSVIETITGEKMLEKFPKTGKEQQKLAADWKKWWKDKSSERKT